MSTKFRLAALLAVAVGSVGLVALVGCSRNEGKTTTTTGKVAKKEPHTIEVPAAVRTNLETAMKEAVFKDYFTVVQDKTEYRKDKGQIVWLLEAEDKIEKVYLPKDFPFSGPFTSDRLAGQIIKYLDKDKLPVVQQHLVPGITSPPPPNPHFDPPYYRLHKGNRTRCTLQLPENIDWSKVESVIVEK